MRNIIAQKTKFGNIISSLSSEFSKEVTNLLLKLTVDQPYDKPRTLLIKLTITSEQWRLQQFISGEELGDRKPTQLLRHMQLFGNKLLKSEC